MTFPYFDLIIIIFPISIWEFWFAALGSSSNFPILTTQNNLQMRTTSKQHTNGKTPKLAKISPSLFCIWDLRWFTIMGLWTTTGAFCLFRLAVQHIEQSCYTIVTQQTPKLYILEGVGPWAVVEAAPGHWPCSPLRLGEQTQHVWRTSNFTMHISLPHTTDC